MLRILRPISAPLPSALFAAAHISNMLIQLTLTEAVGPATQPRKHVRHPTMLVDPAQRTSVQSSLIDR
jgi:hypothetical protein